MMLLKTLKLTPKFWALLISLSLTFQIAKAQVQIDSTTTSYYDSGDIMLLMSYYKGKKSGLSLLFNEQRDLLHSENYQGDSLHGTQIYYEANGKRKELKTFDMGVLDGPSEKYYSNGKVQETIHYEQGFKNGKAIWYYRNGSVVTEYFYKKGKIKGDAINYYVSGSVKNITEYKNNQRHGSFKEFYEDGTLKLKGEFKKGEKTGTWIYFSENGQQTNTVQYTDGILIKE